MVIIVAGLFVTDRVGLKSRCSCAAIVTAVSPPITQPPTHPPKKEKSLVLLTFIILLFLNKQAGSCLGCNTSASLLCWDVPSIVSWLCDLSATFWQEFSLWVAGWSHFTWAAMEMVWSPALPVSAPTAGTRRKSCDVCDPASPTFETTDESQGKPATGSQWREAGVSWYHDGIRVRQSQKWMHQQISAAGPQCVMLYLEQLASPGQETGWRSRRREDGVGGGRMEQTATDNQDCRENC